MKTVNFVKIANAIVVLAGILFAVFALVLALFGQGETSGILGAISSHSTDCVLGMVGVATLADIAPKNLKKFAFEVIEEKTKGGKNALLCIFKRDFADLEHIEDMAKLANLPFFSWPSKLPANLKDTHIAKGMLANPASLQLLENYKKMTFKDAKELKAENAKAKETARAEKKATREANKGGAGAVLAKIKAIQDMIDAGKITALEGAGIIATVS